MYIVDPRNLTIHNVNSKFGKIILKNYINKLIGGSKEEQSLKILRQILQLKLYYTSSPKDKKDLNDILTNAECKNKELCELLVKLKVQFFLY